MPIFEYHCRDCGKQFEEIVYGTAEPSCPSCKSQDLERLISAFAVGSSEKRSAQAPSACGTCGDPRGPGACSMN